MRKWKEHALLAIGYLLLNFCPSLAMNCRIVGPVRSCLAT